MRRLLLCAVAVTAVTALMGSGSAEARCSVKCLNRKVNSLTVQLAQAQQTISQQAQAIQQTKQDLGGLTNCLAEGPLTQYGDPGGTFGYMFDNDAIGSGADPFLTTGLDITASGDGVSGWALFDACNTATVASASAARSSIAPHSAIGAFAGPQFHTP